MAATNRQINEAEFEDLKSRMKLIAEADPSQYHNCYSLRRYLRAFKTPDDAFKVRYNYGNETSALLLFCLGYTEN